MKLRYIVLPIVAVVGIVLAIYTVYKQSRPAPNAPPSGQPTKSPFSNRVAGSGLVEPVTEIMNIGTPIPGTVESVTVKEGQAVKKGDVLFTIDQRELKAQLVEAKARLEVANQKVIQLKSLPRAEEVDRCKAIVAQRQAAVEDARLRLERLQTVEDQSSLSANEKPTREFEYNLAKSRLDESKAELARMMKGTYPEDLAVAAAEAQVAESDAQVLQTNIVRSEVRAPMDGTVLRVNARPGEFIANTAAREGAIILGQLTPLHIRVDVDELDAWRFDPKGKAVAALRGGRVMEFPIEYVRTVPMVIPKRTLTGENSERIDTRVMEMIYRFTQDNPPVLPGQLLDVYIDSGADAPVDHPSRIENEKMAAPQSST
ncbi:MAG: biotin/lipoyl-binding protein [Planctomycetes bacterium]|nr:biotin/lipoyl-binding protein [Planctomycetota bacterium]